jgi:PadR family transcriptional regulator AphA
MRESTTGHVILGVLATIGPASGYEIHQFIRQSVSYFWNESFGQIYPQLKALTAAGSVAPSPQRTRDPRRRQRVRITAAGRRALRSWLERPAAPEQVRVESLVKVFFGHEAAPAVSRAHVAAVAARHLERLALLDRIGGPAVDASAEAPQLVYWLLALRHGHVISRARVRWAGEAERLLAAAERGGNPAVLAEWRALMKENV